ncbi:MAG TPA: HAMP domain-containing histidine kinase [Candidatus Blautia stercoripullorum]|uniref:histidine kinase n=1 Tax=Candidatus Blautia stercoripullorum TaxID=2838502 RepID=A0A9D2R8A7_9FIRM|nr:HAMP domain-containing histidine kinase [Candidatus Blautia stercoripullorum]
MLVLFMVLSAVLLSLLIWQKIEYRTLEKNITYISSRLESLSLTSENGFLLLSTDCNAVKRLGASINRLLQEFYTDKAEFKRSQKAMAQVLTNISHDIRTPLTVLKGNSEILFSKAKESSLPESFQTMAEKIDQKADQLTTTINDYFTMSKIASGDLILNLRKENISQICHDTILDYYDLLEEQQFEVNIQIPSVPVFADTDKEALQRILKNLMDNVIRHGGSGKYLGLCLNTSEKSVKIQIEDHGKGMSPQQQKQIFTRNYTTAGKSFGSGLGLAIAKSLARQIGGEIQVYSIPDKKTVFSVILKS